MKNLQLSTREFADIIAKAVKQGIEQYENDKFITREDAAEFLSSDPRTVINYVKDGLLKEYRIKAKSKPLYKKSEVMALPRAKKAACTKLKAA